MKMTRLAPWLALFAVTAAYAGGCSSGSESSTTIEDAGTDVATCATGTVSCGGACIDTQKSHDNCGACGTACGAAEACVSGKCSTACPTGQTVCGGACATTDTDNSNCGSCGTKCGAGEVCSAGKCATSCASTLTTCGGGDAGAARCANTKTDNENCGACDKKCAAGEACTDGACKLTCASGLTTCGGGDAGAAYCAKVDNDNSNCGACGVKCGAGEVCSAGKCATSCASTLTTCGGGDAGAARCVNTKTDNENCGACDKKCAAGEACTAGACTLTCATGMTVCTGTPSYCANLVTDNANCGTCGTKCAAGQSCSDSSCKPTCAAGLVACGGTCIDPKTSVTNCGATTGCGAGSGSAGKACAASESCFAGACTAIELPVTAGLVARYSALRSASIVTSGTAVTTWRDLSGFGRDLSQNTAPTRLASCINTRPCVDFSAGGGLVSAGFPLTTEMTVFVVAQHRTPGNWGPFAHHGSRDNDWSMENNAFKTANVIHFQSVNDNAGVELTLVKDTNYVLAGRITGTTRYFSATSTAAGTVSTSGTGNSISVGSKPLYVGRSEINEVSNAYIGEIIYYNRPLTDAERDAVLAYLRTVWGI